jgi:hypothetical protein
MFQINGKLSCPIASQFMAPGRWQSRDICKILSCLELHHSLLQFSASFIPQVFAGFVSFRTYFLQLSCFKEYTHQTNWSIFLLTNRVNFFTTGTFMLGLFF